MSTSSRMTPESGLRADRIGVVREATTGVPPSDPDWMLFSDNVQNIDTSPDPSVERKDGLGSPYPDDHYRGMEEAEFTIGYDLQRQLVDGNGDPDDPAGDAMLRNEDGEIYNTHTIVVRHERNTTDPNDPTDTTGARMYTVVLGGYPDLSMEGDPSASTPIPPELTYTAEKIRSYEIYQPPSGGDTVDVVSTSANDTMDVTIEDEGAGTSETITLTGDSSATGATSFDDIDAVYLTDDPEGDVTLSYTSSGSDFMTIRGGEYYSNDDNAVEGDRGVPILGSGSHGTAIGGNYEHFLGDSVQRAANDIPYDLNNVTFEVSNGYETSARSDTYRPRITEGNAEVTISADVIGERASHDYIVQSLGAVGDDIVWTLTSSEITVNNATLTDTIERSYAEDDTTAAVSAQFEGNGRPAINVTQIT